ncbi:MAG: SIS domain-containing protein [Candidatus Paceibacterota bacterium]
MDNYVKTIKKFHEQFSFEPEIINEDKLVRKDKIIIAGMGGSRLVGDILRMWKPDKEIIVHSDYNLPAVSRERLNDSLIIANSYSGNTEETIDAALKALELGLSLAVVAGGGKLIDIANGNGLPYVKVPADHVPARSDLGHDLLAILKVIGDDDGLAEASLLKTMNGEELEDQGKDLAAALQDKISVIYTSERNMELGYIWKIILNETAKVPAFCNRFPELNHNEIAGSESEMSKNFHFVFLRDVDDDRTGRIGLRMEKLDEIYGRKDLPVTKLELEGESHLKKIFSSIVLAHWTAYYLAKYYKVDPEKTEIIEEFKK